MTQTHSHPKEEKRIHEEGNHLRVLIKQLQLLEKFFPGVVIRPLPPLLPKDFPRLDTHPFSQYLCLLNCFNNGFVGSVTAEQMLNVFSSFPGFTRLDMTLGTPFTFVTFATDVDAKYAAEAIQGIYSDILEKVVWCWPVQCIPKECIVHTDPSEIQHLIPGLHIFPDAVDSLKEDDVIQHLLTDGEGGCLGSSGNIKSSGTGWIELMNRRVMHYGYPPAHQSTNPNAPSPTKKRNLPVTQIPEWLVMCMQRYVCSHVEAGKVMPDLPTTQFNQITVNEYQPGTGIGPHVDSHHAFEEPLVVLSLGSPIVMEFRRKESTSFSPAGPYHVCLPARSLAIFVGEARFVWTHTIRSRRTDILNGLVVQRQKRYSLTLRRARGENYICECPYADYCDDKERETNAL